MKQPTTRPMDRVVTVPIEEIAERIADRLHTHHGISAAAAHLVYQTTLSAPPAHARLVDACSRVFLSRRSLNRRFNVLGMPGPSRFVAFVTAVAVIDYARTHSCPINSACRRFGWTNGFNFSQSLVKLIGVRPTAALQLTLEEIVDTWAVRGLSRRQEMVGV